MRGLYLIRFFPRLPNMGGLFSELVHWVVEADRAYRERRAMGRLTEAQRRDMGM